MEDEKLRLKTEQERETGLQDAKPVHRKENDC